MIVTVRVVLEYLRQVVATGATLGARASLNVQFKLFSAFAQGVLSHAHVTAESEPDC